MIDEDEIILKKALLILNDTTSNKFTKTDVLDFRVDLLFLFYVSETDHSTIIKTFTDMGKEKENMLSKVKNKWIDEFIHKLSGRIKRYLSSGSEISDWEEELESASEWETQEKIVRKIDNLRKIQKKELFVCINEKMSLFELFKRGFSLFQQSKNMMASSIHFTPYLREEKNTKILHCPINHRNNDFLYLYSRKDDPLRKINHKTWLSGYQVVLRDGHLRPGYLIPENLGQGVLITELDEEFSAILTNLDKKSELMDVLESMSKNLEIHNHHPYMNKLEDTTDSKYLYVFEDEGNKRGSFDGTKEHEPFNYIGHDKESRIIIARDGTVEETTTSKNHHFFKKHYILVISYCEYQSIMYYNHLLSSQKTISEIHSDEKYRSLISNSEEKRKALTKKVVSELAHYVGHEEPKVNFIGDIKLSHVEQVHRLHNGKWGAQYDIYSNVVAPSKESLGVHINSNSQKTYFYNFNHKDVDKDKVHELRGSRFIFKNWGFQDSEKGENTPLLSEENRQLAKDIFRRKDEKDSFISFTYTGSFDFSLNNLENTTLIDYKPSYDTTHTLDIIFEKRSSELYDLLDEKWFFEFKGDLTTTLPLTHSISSYIQDFDFVEGFLKQSSLSEKQLYKIEHWIQKDKIIVPTEFFLYYIKERQF